MKKANKVIIVTPPVASSAIDMDLVKLTEILSKKLNLDTGCGLGGEYGYGVEYENDVFMMKPYCWCEQDGCPWCYGEAYNFLFKSSKFGIRWYKWIGRDMEYSRKLKKGEWDKIFQECIKSIK